MIKNYINKTFVIIFLLLLNISYLFSQDYSGQNAFQYLKMDASARTVGMGGAFTGVADDISTLRYNPAGLAMILKPEISATHMEWIDDLQINYISFGKPYKSNSSIGFSVFNMTTANAIIGRDSNGYATNSLSYNQMYATCGFATKINNYDNFLLGLNLKYAQEVLSYSDNSALAFDFGLLSKLYHGWNIGFSLRNVGLLSKDSLPFEGRLGVSYLKRNLGFSFDAYQFNDTDIHYATGLEWFFREVMVLRAGYNSSLSNLGALTSDEGLYDLSKYSISGLSLGFGLLTKPLYFFGGYSIKFDYAIVDYGRLGFNHIFSLSMEF